MASRIPFGRAIAALAQEESHATDVERQARRTATLEAYAWLDRQPQGELILEDLALLLTHPCKTEHDEGKRRLVLEIFEAIADGKRVTSEGRERDGS